MNLIRKYKLNKLFQAFDEYTTKEFPNLPLNKFRYSIEYMDSADRLRDYLKSFAFDKAEVELNVIKKEILKHCNLQGYIVKAFFDDDLPEGVASSCEPSGLLNCNIRLKKLPMESYSYIALLMHEIAHIYQIVRGKPLYDETNLKVSEMYTDYLTLYLGFSEEIDFGYILALGGDVPTKLNYLDFEDIKFALRRNDKIPRDF